MRAQPLAEHCRLRLGLLEQVLQQSDQLTRFNAAIGLVIDQKVLLHDIRML